MNKFLATVPFDLYQLHIFTLTARLKSFTRAAAKAGLTQSAVTRAIRGMEHRLGVELFERTTRSVQLTPAGVTLLRKSGRLIEEVETLTAGLQNQKQTPETLRVGIARSIGLSYLPGFFVHFQRKHPGVALQVVQEPSKTLAAKLGEREIDVAIVPGELPLPKGIEIKHQFQDDFVGVIPGAWKSKLPPGTLPPKTFFRAMKNERWLSIHGSSAGGRALARWARGFAPGLEAAVELDTFDLVINLVALGLGYSIVPNRALPLYLNKRTVEKVLLAPRFTRAVSVLARRSQWGNQLADDFAGSVLF